MNSIEQKQAGVVSIFTVLFFMIFVSIVTVGFVKIIGDEQRQSTDNDLSASALAAAQSGVEEGKRVLLYCKATGSTECDSVLGSTSCDAVSGNSVLRSALKINVDGDGAGIVSGNSDYQQRWTCLTIDPVTDDVDDVLINNGDSKIIPLTGTSGYDSVTLSWHATAADKDGTPNLTAGTNRPSQPEWTALNYPAAVRIEFIAHPSGSVDLNAVDAASRTLVLFPSTLAFSTYTVNTADPRAADPNARAAAASPLPVFCNPTNRYACRVTLSLAGMPIAPSAGVSYYARISAVYAKTHINLQLKNGGSMVDFDGVQPSIDVTGKTNDVFRRVRARVMYDTTFYMPNYAIESGQTVCKNMLVTNIAASSQDICNP